MTQRSTQLTQEERYCLYTMRNQGTSLRDIGKAMGRSHTTLSRELKRNTGQKGYRSHQAQRLAEHRHQEKPQAWWSPEQIRGRLRLEEAISISSATVYRFVLKEKHQGGQLSRGLRHQAKPRRTRDGAKDDRGTIPGRVDSADRPAVVETRSRVGDWEADLIIGQDHHGAIVTLAERRSRLFLALPILRKTAELTTQAIIALLAAWKDWTHTMTYDNGREFSGHATMAKALDCQGFFARPYHSWERGVNEKRHGLLRQYFPKGRRLNKVSKEEVFAAVEAMNDRPRKCLGFQTPWEVFTQLTQSNRSGLTNGALMG